jgi:GTP-binding protein
MLNKADRPTCRPQQVESDLFNLFTTLGGTNGQADYPLLYASAKQGWAQ